MGGNIVKIISLALVAVLFSGLIVSEGANDHVSFSGKEGTVDDGAEVLKQIQSDYNSTFEKVFKLVESINSSIASLDQRMETLEKEILQSSQNITRTARGSKGLLCAEPCKTRGSKYSWCRLEGGGWDYCSEKDGYDYRGNYCSNSCAQRGYAYYWCTLSDGNWGYC